MRHLYVTGAVGGKSRESTFLSRAGTRQTQGEPNCVTVLRTVELKTHSPGPSLHMVKAWVVAGQGPPDVATKMTFSFLLLC